MKIKRRTYWIILGIMLIVAMPFLEKKHILAADSTYYTKSYDISNNGTDCTEELQALIDKVWKAGGGTIVFENGTYAFKAINLRSGVNLQGQGIGNTTLKRVSGNTIADAFIYIPYYTKNFSILNLAIWGDKSSDKHETVGIKMQTSSGVTNGTGIINNVHLKEFSGCGVLIGNVKIKLKFYDFSICENAKHGLYNKASYLSYSGSYLEKNGYYGLINYGDGCSFSNIKSIWNGARMNKDSHASWAIFNKGNNCSYIAIEAQDNYCNGIYIGGSNNRFTSILSDCNGYLSEGVWTPQDCILMEITGKNNIIYGTCAQYRTVLKPVAKYAIYSHSTENCKVYVTVKEECSVYGNVSDKEQSNINIDTNELDKLGTQGNDEILGGTIELKENLKDTPNNGIYRVGDYGILTSPIDCTEQLQALIDQVYRNGGGTIQFETGIYKFSSINLRSRVSLKGEGIDKTILKRTSGDNTNGGFVYVPAYAVGFSITELSLKGNAAGDMFETSGVYFESIKDSLGNSVWTFDGDNTDFIKSPNVMVGEETDLRTYKYALLKNISVDDFKGNGLYIGTVNYAITIRNFTAQNNGKCGIYNLSTDNFFIDCNLFNNKEYGVYNLGNNSKFCNIKACYNGSDNTSSYGIYSGGGQCSWSDLNVIGNDYGGLYIGSEGSTFMNVIVDSNGIKSNKTSSQIYIEGTRIQVSGICRNILYIEPVARYAVNMGECSSCSIYIKEEKNASLEGSITKKDQFFSNEIGDACSIAVSTVRVPVKVENYSGVYSGLKQNIDTIRVDTSIDEYSIFYSKDTELTEDNYYFEGVSQFPEYVDAGEYKLYYYVVASGYMGTSGNISVTILPKTLSKNMIKLNYESYVYNGKDRKPIPSLVGTGYTNNTPNAFSLSYKNNRYPGTATIIISGKNNFTGTVKLNYTIKKGKQTLTIPASSITKTYESGASFKLNVTNNGDGALSYKSGNSKVVTVSSKGTVKIKGYGTTKIKVTAAETNKYGSVSKSITIKIIPKKNALKTYSSKKKKTVDLTWSKNNTVTGYLIQYSTSKNFAKYKYKWISNKNTSLTMKDLTSGKYYYFRIRNYVTVNGVRYYSNWSAIKSVKIK